MNSLTIPVEQEAQKSLSLFKWLNGQSKYGTVLMKVPVSRLTVLKINLGAVIMVLLALLANFIE